MDDQRLLYLSPAWKTVLGSDPAELYDTPIEDLLAPGDADVFAEASRQLEANQSHTVEAVFRLRVEKSLASSSSSTSSVDDQSDGSDAVYFQEMEGKGMLMIDRQNGAPSHSMWVFKATGPPEREDRLPDAAMTKGGRSMGAVLDEPTAHWLTSRPSRSSLSCAASASGTSQLGSSKSTARSATRRIDSTWRLANATRVFATCVEPFRICTTAWIPTLARMQKRPWSTAV